MTDWSQGTVDWLRDLCAYWWTGTTGAAARRFKVPQFTTELTVSAFILHVQSPSPDIAVGDDARLARVARSSSTSSPSWPTRRARRRPRRVLRRVPVPLGYGFSDKPAEPATSAASPTRAASWPVSATTATARWRRLGRSVSSTLGQHDAAHVAGVHVNMAIVGPDPDTWRPPFAQRRWPTSARCSAGYRHARTRHADRRPRLRARRLTGGQAAWIAEKYGVDRPRRRSDERPVAPGRRQHHAVLAHRHRRAVGPSGERLGKLVGTVPDGVGKHDPHADGNLDLPTEIMRPSLWKEKAI